MSLHPPLSEYIDHINQSLSWRYATKQFNPSQKVSEESLEALLNALHLSPSSFGLQPWKFIVVSDPALMEKLREHSWNQPQVVEASHLIVLACARSVTPAFVDEHLEHMAQIRSISIESLTPYRNIILPFIQNLTDSGSMEAWTALQTYLALGMLLSTAAFLRIDTCPLEGISPSNYDDLLGLESSNFTTKVACAIGYRSSDDSNAGAKKVRAPIEQVIVRR